MTFVLNVYFLLFLAGYFFTYPLRVLMQNNELSVLPLTVAPGAALVRGLPVPQHIQRQGVTETALSPQRLLA